MTPVRVRGLYAVTRPSPHLEAEVEAALQGGARLIQYRDKSASPAGRSERAGALTRLCARYDALLIINDDPELARAVGAAGVHLGRDDPGIAVARRSLGPSALIGVSCYNDLARAYDAVGAGADYIAFGSFFPSTTKPDAVHAPVSLLAEAKRAFAVPVVAIGGITPDNGRALVATGADALAVIEGVFAQPDIVAATRRYMALFS